MYINGLEQGKIIGHDVLDQHISFVKGYITSITGIPGHGKSDLLDDNDYRTLAEGKSVQKVHTKFIKNATGCKIVNMTHTLKPKFRQIV